MKNEIEQESLSCGAPCFVRKPIKPNDPNNMWKHALDHRINGKFISINDAYDRNNNNNLIVTPSCSLSYDMIQDMFCYLSIYYM